MSKAFFKHIELSEKGSRYPARDIISQLSFNEKNLIPVITQEAETGQVLMMAWMNPESLQYSLDSGLMTYWSRSRNTLWKKGETSGHFQHIVSMQVDCDGDTLLFKVNQVGAACHTGRKHCFYFSLDSSEPENQTFVIAENPSSS
ncbi:phosphoribosyl-AMP cyclohydrolase [Bacterioplanoides sp. SCSIO 12839]|uniref:phosphoribosyl-AMP cyclohydrolase n=1 Tax=Bacterioplanoides sp. SCSIO 12839 TaxID=2829569 RepID=UPI002107B744|nr:phosphoribosyl-AMP cyclohydrolase [Bacterioplanoides sp. SCSIO 12839]UTW49603.1 phosphoribosyl-AMP cyclohydrolase [Bacterioplanoides sp. SCSIO 12839]